MFGQADKGSDNHLTFMTKKQPAKLAINPVDKRRLRSAMTRTTKAGWMNPNNINKSAELNLSHHSYVLSS